MAREPKTTPAATTPSAAAPEPVKVEIVTTTPDEPKLSAQTLAEQKAGREALASHTKRT